MSKAHSAVLAAVALKLALKKPETSYKAKVMKEVYFHNFGAIIFI